MRSGALTMLSLVAAEPEVLSLEQHPGPRLILESRYAQVAAY